MALRPPGSCPGRQPPHHADLARQVGAQADGGQLVQLLLHARREVEALHVPAAPAGSGGRPTRRWDGARGRACARRCARSVGGREGGREGGSARPRRAAPRRTCRTPRRSPWRWSSWRPGARRPRTRAPSPSAPVGGRAGAQGAEGAGEGSVKARRRSARAPSPPAPAAQHRWSRKRRARLEPRACERAASSGGRPPPHGTLQARHTQDGAQARLLEREEPLAIGIDVGLVHLVRQEHQALLREPVRGREQGADEDEELLRGRAPGPPAAPATPARAKERGTAVARRGDAQSSTRAACTTRRARLARRSSASPPPVPTARARTLPIQCRRARPPPWRSAAASPGWRGPAPGPWGCPG